MEQVSLRAYLVDDEPLAIDRLKRLLAGFPAIEIAGSATDPKQAVQFLKGDDAGSVDVLFLDIQMPGMNGFELLSHLTRQPFVIFTTAYDQHALQAFEANTIDYLLKPIEAVQLERAITKLGRLRPILKPGWQQTPDLPALLRDLAASLHSAQAGYPQRIASRVGERVSFLVLDDVTHFVARDKLTFAVVDGKSHSVDQTIADLERRLDPAKFLRIHRSALVNVDWVFEVNSWFAGKVILTLKDTKHTQLTVARDRVRTVKERLGI
ncbi:MAG TPA: LytTR family DNA-binding domain-containing protein [Terracidiphilus sp.]|nr:LytTR family DNA-binding domain-containing protein [Terracidiphilus sp.]